MKILISPAKKMRRDLDGMPPQDLPPFLDAAHALLERLRGMDYPALKKLLACNNDIATLNYDRYRDMDLRRNLTPALFAYEGIQYRYMAPGVFTGEQLEYVQGRLCILSGFYGVLRPFDGVVPYRLEMQAKLDLYRYWGERLARWLEGEDHVLLNLASEEYAKAVYPHLQPGTRWITPVFGEEIGGKVVEKGVYVKMARGEMVRFLAEQGAQEPEEAKAFRRLGYTFQPSLSDETRYVFLKEKGSTRPAD